MMYTELPFTVVIENQEAAALHAPTRKMALAFATPSARSGKKVEIFANENGSRSLDTHSMEMLAKRVEKTAKHGAGQVGSTTVYNALMALSHRSGQLAKQAVTKPITEPEVESLIRAMNEASAALEA